jgi:hypothetical protein
MAAVAMGKMFWLIKHKLSEKITVIDGSKV